MAAAAATSHYVCSLSPELVAKAEKELNEKAQWRSRDVQAFREMVQAHKGIIYWGLYTVARAGSTGG